MRKSRHQARPPRHEKPCSCSQQKKKTDWYCLIQNQGPAQSHIKSLRQHHEVKGFRERSMGSINTSYFFLRKSDPT